MRSLPPPATLCPACPPHATGIHPSATAQPRPCHATSPAGFSGAELANVVNEAAFLAARTAGDSVGLPELVEAVQRTRWGPGAPGRASRVCSGALCIKRAAQQAGLWCLT